MKQILFIKIGGGLITDKTRYRSLKEDVLQAAAQRIAEVYKKYHLTHGIILGNGAGSFGHSVAVRYMRPGIATFPVDGLAAVHQSVVELNARVVRALIEAGVPAFSVAPSTFISCRDGVPHIGAIRSIETLLQNGAVPVVYGDIIPDTVRVGSILSTEKIFSGCIDRLRATYKSITVVFGMKEGGVLDGDGHGIPILTRDMLHTTYKEVVYRTNNDDVTGGMRHKIATALELSKKVERIYIASLCDDSLMRIAAGSHAGSRIALDSYEHERVVTRGDDTA